MTTLLRVDSSALSQGSNSKYLAEQYQAEWMNTHPDGKVIHRDLAKQPPAHLSEGMIGAMYTPSKDRTEAQKNFLADSETFLEEVKQADTLLISVPMYNFGIPSSLKAYLDHIIRVGETFVYTENGPKGLLNNKQAVIILTSGGNYTEAPSNQFDHVTPYLRTALGFMGIEDVKLIVAPNMAMEKESKQQALNTAEEALMKAV